MTQCLGVKENHAASLLLPLLYYQPISQGLLWPAIGFITDVLLLLLLSYKLCVDWVVRGQLTLTWASWTPAGSSPCVQGSLPSPLRMQLPNPSDVLSSSYPPPLLNVETGNRKKAGGWISSEEECKWHLKPPTNWNRPPTDSPSSSSADPTQHVSIISVQLEKKKTPPSNKDAKAASAPFSSAGGRVCHLPFFCFILCFVCVPKGFSARQTSHSESEKI